MIFRYVPKLLEQRKRLAPEGHVADAATFYGYRVLARVLERIGGRVGVVAGDHRRLGMREFILRQDTLGLEIGQRLQLRCERGHCAALFTDSAPAIDESRN